MKLLHIRTHSELQLAEHSPPYRHASKFSMEGLPIVPLKPKSKEPFPAYSSLLPIRNPKELFEFYSSHPDANYGVKTGIESGLVVLDVDGEEGRAALAALIKEHGEFPQTLEVTTGRGQHFYFRTGNSHKNSVGMLGPGLDLRGEGGYVVGPGSRHPDGARYRLASNSKFFLPKIAAGDWLEQAMRKSAKPPLAKIAVSVGKILEGHRNTHLTRLAGKMHRDGMSPEAILGALTEENKVNCSPPLPDEEISKIVESVSRYASQPVEGDLGEFVAQQVLDLHYKGGDHLKRFSDGAFWAYDGRCWGRFDSTALRQKALDVLKDGILPHRASTANLVSQVLSLLEAKVFESEDLLRFQGVPPSVFNLRNGELWIGADGEVQLRPHQATSYLRHYMDFDYQPHARAPLFEAAIKEIFSKSPDGEALSRHYFEYLGYLMQPDRRIPMVCIWKGGGSNGKSALAGIVRAMVGPQQVAAQRIKELSRNQFSMDALFGKFLLIDEDVQSGTRLPDGDLKKISEQTDLTAERKFGATYNFVNRAVPLLLCNSPPSLADLSYAMQRRLHVLPFNRIFLQKEIDRSLFPKILEREKSGILNHAIAGLQRVIRRGWDFDLPQSMVEAQKLYLREANPLPEFIEECCAKEGRITVAKLFSEYETWRQQQGITYGQQRSNFERNILSLGYTKKHCRDGANFLGLSLKFD